MVKKLKQMAEAQKSAKGAGLLEGQLAQTVKDSAQQIWLAGLGAFAKAQGEGSKVFDTLMKEGLSLHRKTQSAAEEKLGDVAGRMSQMAGQVTQQANASWDKLETIFEQRTARALARLGVPGAADLAALNERLDQLAAAVAALGGEAVSAAAAPRKVARKAGAKAARKSAAKAAPAAAAPAAVEAQPATRKPRAPARRNRSAAVADGAPAADSPAASAAPARKAARKSRRPRPAAAD